MAENQKDKTSSAAAAQSWQLRSPGRPAEKRAASDDLSRIERRPQSPSHAPQPLQSAYQPAPLKARFERLARLTENFSTRTKLALATGGLVAVSSIMALFSQASPADADEEHATEAETTKINAPAAADPYNRIMGKGKPYIPAPPPEAKAYAFPRLDFHKFARGPGRTPVIDSEIDSLIKSAASAEGLHPDLMIELFGKESGLGRKNIGHVLNARSDTNASGICQFTEQTFLSTLAKDGGRLGFGKYADAVYTVAGKNNRTYYTAGKYQRDILNLRFDPEIAIPLCAAHIKRDLMAMSPYIKRPLTFADSATSHFTGWAVAKDIIRAYDDPKARRDPAYIYAERGNYAGSDTNMSLFFRNGDRRKPYTVAEFYEAKMRIVGNERALAEVIPNGTRLAQRSP
ncbi:MAG: hypothetical protein HYS17_04425 [Micavibrio aeruginosavorus]|uniref:Transglycosylase SLT domain-containing protein n=1 Tax=Micavibrio aeruginosavorus TaxID=349221 RepID=A0A7T5UI17_9BACT|nr:MAG: hypothetical protein HYS17_04425 [Micavibrio aeruginosavorus]